MQVEEGEKMNEDQKASLIQEDIELEYFTIFSSYEILQDGTIIFSAED